MKLDKKTIIRLKDILKQDKENVSRPLLSLIKSDVYSVFSNYFETKLEDVEIIYYVGEDNKYHFDVRVLAQRPKKMNFLSV